MTTPSGIGGKSSSAQPSSSNYHNITSTPNAYSGFGFNQRLPQRTTSAPIATPRKGQGERKSHRNSKRPSYRGGEDDMDDIRAIRNVSSRRNQTSITHLLDYTAPRSQFQSFSYNRNYRRNPTWGPGSGYHAADKTRYVHANYRFIVSPQGDYSKQAADADEHLDWDDVLQVVASAESQAASCPICLSEPVAPRMAKCGHIFCLPCLLRYTHTSTSDDPTAAEKRQRWRKCPICDDTVYTSDTRPVRFYAGQESPLPRPGDDVVLRLMMRYDKSALALPKEGGAEVFSPGNEIPWHYAANVLDYARIMRGTVEYMSEEYDREVEDLTKQEKEDELMYNEDTEWTQKAIAAIRNTKEKLQELREAQETREKLSRLAGSSKARQSEHDFYFYTSPPHLYLSPLDIRILKTKYGDFSQFPTTLLPRVEHISTGNPVDDTMRKRAKWLGHLPRGCLVSFLECDWTDIVPEDILETFKDEIERRRKRNHEKEVQEDRERLQSERIEAASYRRNAGRTNFSAMDDVTVRFSAEGDSRLNLDDFQPLGSSGVTPPNPRSGFASFASMSTSPSTQRTVWGTTVVQTSPGLGPVEPPANLDDGWLKDDQVLENLGTAELAIQMEQLGMEIPAATGSSSANAGGKGKGKKKRKEKITLMSTGGKRGS